MSQQKKSGSCLGLFIKSFIVSLLGLSILATLTVMMIVKLFGGDYSVWTDFSRMSSHPWLAIYGVVAMASIFSFGLAAFSEAVRMLFGRGKKDRSRSTPSRPTSNRRTTV